MGSCWRSTRSTASAPPTSGTASAAPNPGPHGFSEILYAFSSAANNNGSAFAGLSVNTPFYNAWLGVAMAFGRFGVIVPVLAATGSLAAKKRAPATGGTMPTHGPLFVSLLIVRSGWSIVRRAGHVLLEGTPEGIDAGTIKTALAALPGIADVHHIHVWSLGSGSAIATLHLRLASGAVPGQVLPAVKSHLRAQFGIAHSTVEIDPDDRCADHETHARA